MSNFPEKIWCKGKMVPWAEANVHVMTHALHYGSGELGGHIWTRPDVQAVLSVTP
jgi:branched-subunit amino acid aminotransferase/4-amino-4-deoxychorismate lyase